jgi:predicted aspartyl protease
MWQTMKPLFMAAWLLMFATNVLRATGEEYPQVPLLDGGDMILVPVEAFHQTLYFIVDTGFTISAIDTKYQRYLGGQMAVYSAVSPLGTIRDVPLYHCPDLSLAGKPLALFQIVGLDLRMLSLITGQPCDGVLGMDWFAKNVVAIDFDAKTFSPAAETPKIVRNTYAAVTLEHSNGYYAMQVLVNQAKTLNLMIDTGDSGSLSFNQEIWREVYSTNQPKTMLATVADAVNQVARTKIGVVGRLAVQGLHYTNLHAMFILNPDQPSRLGLRFFERHKVVFDFARQRLYLQPGRSFSIPDTEDMSGLHLLRDGRTTYVYAVDDASPALAQGVKADDVLESVNDRPASSLTMKSIRQMLRSGDGDRIVLQLRRGGMVWDVQLRLKSPFESGGRFAR